MTAQFPGSWEKRAATSLNGDARSAPTVGVKVAIALALLLGANAFAAAFVSGERFVYFWDWSFYWLCFQEVGKLTRQDAFAAVSVVSESIRHADYNLLPLVPLIPFELLSGSSRTSYVLAITTAGVVPSAALMAWLPERMAENRSWPRYLLGTALVLCLHPLWTPALRGFPDVIGVIIAGGILLAYFAKPLEQQRLGHFVLLGLLMCMLILTRRWYLFWVTGFFPAAIVAQLASGAARTRRGAWCTARGLFVAGAACLAFLLILAAPMVIRVASTDYAAAYAAYRSSAGPVSQVTAQFGLALLLVAACGLAFLVRQPGTRRLGILVAVQAPFSLLLFTHVQEFLGVQHYYILVPTLGIGVAGAVMALWSSPVRPAWRAASSTLVAGLLLFSSMTVFTGRPAAAGGIFPRNTYPPLVRNDLREIERLLDRLSALNPRSVYVVASSEVLNWSMLKAACREGHPDLCARVAVGADIDMRDGFPTPLADADFALLATPTQFHLDPSDQQVVGLLARDLGLGQGIGKSFKPLPGEFRLDGGVRVQIYRRIAPLALGDLEALSAQLQRSYPGVPVLR